MDDSILPNYTQTTRTSPRPGSSPDTMSQEQMKAVLKFMNKQTENTLSPERQYKHIKFSKQELTPLEKLVSVPANHVSRFRDIPIEDSLKVKIFGKPKDFSAN